VRALEEEVGDGADELTPRGNALVPRQFVKLLAVSYRHPW
jgi:hypothetical protein